MSKKTRKIGKPHPLRLAILIFLAIVSLIALVVVINVKSHDFCANSISCIKDLSGKKSADKEGIFMGKHVPVPQSKISQYALQDVRTVLGDTTGGNKHIYVDLTKQRLLAYEGDQLIYDFAVSTGKWNPTPTGDFKIWIWLRYTRMAGGNTAIGTYYNLPNVPYTMYFYNDSTPKSWGYSLHGTYWHNNFGHPMSHGCVNMKIEEAGKIFYWTQASPDTPITIYGTTPKA